MLKVFKSWYERNFTDPQAVFLLFLLVLCFTVILIFGNMLMPVFAAIVIAYLLEWFVKRLQRYGSSRVIAVWLIWFVFLAFLIFLVFGISPLLSSQIADFTPELSHYWAQGQLFLTELPKKYPVFDEKQMQHLVDDMRTMLGALGKDLLFGGSLKSITSGFITMIIYLVLVPLLVLFFLKDKTLMLAWICRFLPKERTLIAQVWTELDLQLGNYIRGKTWEILIVTTLTYLVFAVFGLKYAFLLAVIVGISVLIPYIGVIIVTLPVVVVAYFQFGISSEFLWLMALYFIIQGLDGGVLVPVLFSEVVNLHPVAIIVSVLVFGGVWGFWGVFFAIPLATLVNATLHAWPRVAITSTAPPPVRGII